MTWSQVTTQQCTCQPQLCSLSTWVTIQPSSANVLCIDTKLKANVLHATLPTFAMWKWYLGLDFVT